MKIGIALLICVGGVGAGALPAQAFPVDPCDVWVDCTPPPPPPPSGPAYNLQGVIQNEGSEVHPDGYLHGRRAKIRGYSRLATWGNDRVDADYINVRCFAYDALGGYRTDYDSENGGALVDVSFVSNYVTGSTPAARTITVSCTHHATKNGVTYETTSSTAIQLAI
ncbi:hypothetical protein [Micromonospora sp. M71_S20]|uniref:hypothetical protein n=1 Tax=Micromonospora sp. M71_S20 TaxID=592872 RepID=UPI000EB588FF|nr:hypothetical protein [Micromonospora sp. M71_S20]